MTLVEFDLDANVASKPRRASVGGDGASVFPTHLIIKRNRKVPRAAVTMRAARRGDCGYGRGGRDHGHGAHLDTAAGAAHLSG